MPRTQKEEKLHSALLKQLLTLATGGFGLAAALAWNKTIEIFIDERIKPYLQHGSGLISQLLYALAITIIAVLITYYLTKLSQK